MSEAKAYREYIFRNEFETMNVFEQENNSGGRINPDSRINYPIWISSLIRPNLNIPLTRPTENMTRPTENSPLTQPTDFELPTGPTDFELLIRPTELWEENENSTYQMTRTHNHYCQTGHWRKRNAIRRKSFLSIGKMTRHTHLLATFLILLMIMITDSNDSKIRNTGKRIRSNNAQL